MRGGGRRRSGSFLGGERGGGRVGRRRSGSFVGREKGEGFLEEMRECLPFQMCQYPPEWRETKPMGIHVYIYGTAVLYYIHCTCMVGEPGNEATCCTSSVRSSRAVYIHRCIYMLYMLYMLYLLSEVVQGGVGAWGCGSAC